MTRDIDEVLNDLGQPLDRNRVKQVDTGGGRKADYLEGYDVIETANRIFGYDGWAYRVLTPPMLTDAGVYVAEVEVEVLGVKRSDIGTNALAGDRASHHEMSIKGAVTDALKRALRSFGNQFGNDLYDKSPDASQGAPARPPAARPLPPVNRAPAQGFVEPPSPNAPGGMTTAGDFYSYAFTQLGLGRDATDGLLGLKRGEPLGNPNEAKVKLDAAYAAVGNKKGAETNG